MFLENTLFSVFACTMCVYGQVTPSLYQAKKEYDEAVERYQGHTHLDLDPNEFKEDFAVVGDAYAVVFEAKAAELMLKPASASTKKKAIEQELQKVSKFSKLFNTRIRESIHKSLLTEANSIILDA